MIFLVQKGTGYNVEVMQCNTHLDETIEALTLTRDKNLEREETHPSKRHWNMLIEGAKHHSVDYKHISCLESQPHFCKDVNNAQIRKRIGCDLFLLSQMPIVVPTMTHFAGKKMFKVKSPRFVHIGMSKALPFSWVNHDHVFAKKNWIWSYKSLMMCF